jgi:predicted MFS family arabinose efflux permease
MMVLAMVLSRALPLREPRTQMTYGELMGSMVHLVRGTPILRRRAFYQACLFFAFSLFWTTTPLLLAGPHYGLTQNGIALFALAGVSGAIAAPIAGRVADRGWGQPGTGCAISLVGLAMLGSILVPQGSAVALSLLGAAAIAVDFGVQANLIFGYRAIFALAPEARGRLNGVYLSSAFVGGAIGSALGAWAFARGGWSLACCVGITPPIIALARFSIRVTTGRE